MFLEGWVELTYISTKVDEVFIKLIRCGLDYILILIKYRVFYVKLTNLLIGIQKLPPFRSCKDFVSSIVTSESKS
jgi:hypothetical protein